MTQTTAMRYDTLDAMRGLAAVAVLIYHFTMHGGALHLFDSAPLAVDLFFCLSGYVIAHAYQQKLQQGMGLRAFLRVRLIRLYPAYLAGFALGAVALTAKYLSGQTDMSAAGIVASMALNLVYLPFPGTHSITLYHDTIPQALFPVNDPGWSLFFEFAANILFFFSLRARRLKPLVVLLIMAPAFFVTTKLFGEAAGWGAGNMIGGLPRVGFAFFAGAVLYQYRTWLARLPALPAGLVLTILLLLLAVPAFRLHTYYWFIASVCFVPPLVALGSRCKLGPRGQRWAAYWGGLSYPLYCVHFPLLSLLSALAPPSLPLLTLGMAVALLLAHGLYRYGEKPIGRWLAGKIPA